MALDPNHFNTNGPSTTDLSMGAWGDYAQMLIRKHYQQQPEVLADRHPEPLRKMRVGLRRLRVTLKTFGKVLNLPIKQENRALQKLGRKLSQLRDLDVQTKTLKQTYRPRLPKAERNALDQLLKQLKQHRKQVLKKNRHALRDRPYQQFQKTYGRWLAQPLPPSPHTHAPVDTMAAPVLSAQLEWLLAHPGWQITAQPPLT
ncbi:MAG: CHAD domain-containing protein [Cyanobacteria bacterium P01_G01_bin.54]